MDQSFNILIVDDVATNRELAKHIVKAEGYTADTAVDGRSALEMIASRSYDLVLLDVVMPGLDGFEVCQRIRQQPQFARLPVILLSGFDEYVDMLTRAKEVGATSFLPKSSIVERLAEEIAKALEY